MTPDREVEEDEASGEGAPEAEAEGEVELLPASPTTAPIPIAYQRRLPDRYMGPSRLTPWNGVAVRLSRLLGSGGATVRSGDLPLNQRPDQNHFHRDFV